MREYEAPAGFSRREAVAGDETIALLNRVARTGSIAMLLFVSAFAQAAYADNMPGKECANGALPAFANYAVHEQNASKRPRPTLRQDNTFSHRYKTRLGNALNASPVDFAGHYVVVTIGCGNGCLSGGYIDVTTGQARRFPFFVIPTGLPDDEDPIAGKPDSRLLKVGGNLNGAEGPPMKYFFTLQDGKLERICHAAADTGISSTPGK